MMKLPQEEMEAIARRAKSLRLSDKLTQDVLAERSGVSLGSIKRFERTGKISLESLLKIAFILDSMEGFGKVFIPKNYQPAQSLDSLIKASKQRKRGVKR